MMAALGIQEYNHVIAEYKLPIRCIPVVSQVGYAVKIVFADLVFHLLKMSTVLIKTVIQTDRDKLLCRSV
jgi:hypothetical protein